jgi:colanic acid/amylovoran biosynthesis protein
MDLVFPKKILIINVHSTMNAGDAALLWLNMQQLAKAFPKATFTALANYPHESYYAHLTDLEVMSSPFDLIQAGSTQSAIKKIFRLVVGCIQLVWAKLLPLKWLENSPSPWLRMAFLFRSTDMVAAVSGAQLVSLGRYSWPLIVSSVPILITHYFRKPLYVLPQSIGPLRWQWEKALVRRAYSPARIVMMRDIISLNLAKDIGLSSKNVKFAYDPGFALPMESSDKALEVMSSYGYLSGVPAIGITVISQLSKSFEPSALTHYYHVLAETLARFAKTYHAEIYIFDQVRGPTIREDDGSAAEFLLDISRKKDANFSHVKSELSPIELKACYSLMDLFIASRMHSGIFAMSAGVPTVFIGYNPKTKGFLDAVGLSQLLLDLNTITEDHFYDLLCQSWENRQELTRQTSLIVDNCKHDYDRVSKWILEDYQNAHES